jgi:hypothetical protein
MRVMCKWLGVFCLIMLVVQMSLSAPASKTEPLATLKISSNMVQFLPHSEAQGVVVTISAPDGVVYAKEYKPGDPIVLQASYLTEGLYKYELRPVAVKVSLRSEESIKKALRPTVTQSGTFRMEKGSLVLPTQVEEISGKRTQSFEELKRLIAPSAASSQDEPNNDNVVADDQIVTGSLCVGFDCLTDGTESFGFDTVRLKENNLQIDFDDTSATAGFPANDWKIVINDSYSGGANYFAISDTTNSKVPFKVEANAPTNSIRVDSYGRLGLKTATPAVELHIADGDTPTTRLEQDASSGWTAQVWDLAGNESNFFIRDVTGGSKLPFRIQPGAPTNTITMKSDGKVGIGTWSPAYPMELDTTGLNASIVVKRTDGATNFINATTEYANFGAVTNHPVRIYVNSSWRMRINGDSSIAMLNGATLTAGGVWTNASSRELKENIMPLDAEEALAALKEMSPVKYNYKADPKENHVGFIAEDAPELVATSDRKGMSPMDVTAVLAKVVQQQQQTIEELKAKLEELEKRSK